MAGAFQYKPKFVDIRVRPPKSEDEEAAAAAADVHSLKPGEKPCEWQGCRNPGTAKAPKSREMLNQHYLFCQGHAAAYNRNWNFFAGMTEAQAQKEMEERLTGGRPTWEFRASRNSREAASFANKAGTGNGYSDPFDMLGRRAAAQKQRVEEARKRVGLLERKALAELDLDETAEKDAIRTRYTELVKRCHPDANGGDRSAEHRLQRVIKAYKTLRSAGLA